MDDFDGMLVFTLLVFILIWFFIAYILRGLKKYFTVMKNGKACRAKIDSPGSQIRGAYYPLITYKTKGGLKLKWYSKYGFTKRQLKKLQKSGIDIHYLEDEPLEFVIDKNETLMKKSNKSSSVLSYSCGYLIYWVWRKFGAFPVFFRKCV